MISNKMKVVIIEDNANSLQKLSSMILQYFPEIEIVSTAKSIIEGIQIIQLSNPEIVFLDIELEDGLGFEILDALTERDFEIIFTTAFNTYYEKAIEHFAFNYLLKPINRKALEKSIVRYKAIKFRHFSQSKYIHFKEFIKKHNSKVLIDTGQEYLSVELNSIICFKAEGNYCKVILDDKKSCIASNLLKHYEELLLYKNFFRANRSILVNINHISKISKRETIVLSNHEKIWVSPKNKQEFSLLLESFQK